MSDHFIVMKNEEYILSKAKQIRKSLQKCSEQCVQLVFILRWYPAMLDHGKLIKMVLQEDYLSLRDIAKQSFVVSY